MSTRRSVGSRVALLGATFVTLAAGGCRLGPNPALSPVARSPEGVVVRVDWRGPDEGDWSPTAEVLGFGEAGLYLLQGGSIVLYPLGSPTVLRPSRGGPGPLDLRTADEEARRAFAQYARYPFGFDADLIRRMLDAMEEDSVLVRGGS